MSVVRNKIEKSEIDINYFNQRVEKTDSCWVWTGAFGTHGYGLYLLKKRKLLAHRVSYCLEHGEISTSHVIDHMCKNEKCVRPDHLRQVSQKINATENSNSPIRFNHDKTHCKHGHELSGYNLKMVYRYREKRSSRVCRTCYNRIQLQAYHNRQARKQNE